MGISKSAFSWAEGPRCLLRPLLRARLWKYLLRGAGVAVVSALPLAEPRRCREQMLTLHGIGLNPNCIPFDW